MISPGLTVLGRMRWSWQVPRGRAVEPDARGDRAFFDTGEGVECFCFATFS